MPELWQVAEEHFDTYFPGHYACFECALGQKHVSQTFYH
jgi:hypothetical protein